MPSALLRYLRTLRTFWTTAIAAEMEYRLNFLLAVVVSTINAAGSVFALSLFYRADYAFAGWNWPQALMVVGLYTFLEGFSRSLLNANLNRIVEHVQEGTLDFILLKPIDTQFWLSTRNFSPWGLPNVLIGTGLIVYGGVHSDPAVTPAGYALGLLPVALSLVILYSLWFMLATLSVWFVKVYNITEVLRSLLEAGRYPMAAYPVGWQFFFTFVIPVAFMTTVPARAMLGRLDALWIAGAILLALALLTLSRRFWRFALRFYTSASSWPVPSAIPRIGGQLRRAKPRRPAASLAHAIQTPTSTGSSGHSPSSRGLRYRARCRGANT